MDLRLLLFVLVWSGTQLGRRVCVCVCVCVRARARVCVFACYIHVYIACTLLSVTSMALGESKYVVVWHYVYQLAIFSRWRVLVVDLLIY